MKKIFGIFSCVFFLFVFFSSLSFSDVLRIKSDDARKLTVIECYGKLPHAFIKNNDQVKKKDSYYMNGTPILGDIDYKENHQSFMAYSEANISKKEPDDQCWPVIIRLDAEKGEGPKAIFAKGWSDEQFFCPDVGLVAAYQKDSNGKMLSSLELVDYRIVKASEEVKELYRGKTLLVIKVGSEILVKNISKSLIAIRVSWDKNDPWGTGKGSDSFVDNWVPPENSVNRKTGTHKSVQVWAWGRSGGLIDSCSSLLH